MIVPAYDVIVAGLGAMGSAACWHLARRGVRVLGVDRFSPPHALGSSHGRSRIIREAYFEDPLYVALVRRAYQCWEELALESGRRLYLGTGGLMIGSPGGVLVRGARESAEQHGIPHEILGGAELRRRFPAFHPADGDVGLHELRAGVLFPERCIESSLDLARRHGAEFRLGEPVLRWEPDGVGVRVETASGPARAGALVLATGAWMQDLLGPLSLPLTIERQMTHWFEPAEAPELLVPARCPISLWEYAPGRLVYTFPDMGDGVKIGIHHEGKPTDPTHVRRTTSPEEDETVRALLHRLLPGATGALRESAVCLYTNTPDEHFILDRHPAYPQVILASPCSGHGFKFASAIGEILADLATGRVSGFDLAPFALSRFGT